MRPGSVIIDVAVDQGGSVETIDHVTTHENPTYVKHGVVHYAVSNMPGAVPRTSTYALTNATLPTSGHRGQGPGGGHAGGPQPAQRAQCLSGKADQSACGRDPGTQVYPVGGAVLKERAAGADKGPSSAPPPQRKPRRTASSADGKNQMRTRRFWEMRLRNDTSHDGSGGFFPRNQAPAVMHLLSKKPRGASLTKLNPPEAAASRGCRYSGCRAHDALQAHHVLHRQRRTICPGTRS